MLGSPLELRTRLGPHLGSAAKARSLVASALRRWGRADLVDDVRLVTSELVTNAVLHAAGSDIELVVLMTDRAIRVEVHDAVAGASPARRVSTTADTTGRGLALVEALAASWGVDTSAGGKRVWAEVG